MNTFLRCKICEGEVEDINYFLGTCYCSTCDKNLEIQNDTNANQWMIDHGIFTYPDLFRWEDKSLIIERGIESKKKELRKELLIAQSKGVEKKRKKEFQDIDSEFFDSNIRRFKILVCIFLGGVGLHILIRFI